MTDANAGLLAAQGRRRVKKILTAEHSDTKAAPAPDGEQRRTPFNAANRRSP
ncbi:hypothetical protein [Virgisporangium aurantiacum]|uniref:hypothetical protein n=1 Tax=Virgisporangium aurantiacum TaxID=175570 RepID=UPI001950F532|nr:hypothetical protein [Virgisporangium aurantiacum]